MTLITHKINYYLSRPLLVNITKIFPKCFSINCRQLVFSSISIFVPPVNAVTYSSITLDFDDLESSFIRWTYPFFPKLSFLEKIGLTLPFILTIILIVGLLIFLLINIAFATLAERKIMASIQRRTGPNVIGFLGFLQPFADGLKAILKEPIIPRNANFLLFIFAPNLVLFLSLVVWIFIPLNFQSYTDFSLTLLYIMVISVLEIYGTLFAGWASNSKYALLGGLRSTAQMVAYEIALGFVILCIVLISGSLNLIDIVLVQYYSNTWFIIPLLPLALIFSICMLAETNRTPFDLPEAEAELVAGYNVEYSGLLFAFFFLGEYSNMLVLSSLFTLLFLGGWTCFPLSMNLDIVNSLIFSSKVLFVFFFFIWVRATLPRYRYDQLLNIGWQIFLPLTFGFLLFLIVLLFLADAFPYFQDTFYSSTSQYGNYL